MKEVKVPFDMSVLCCLKSERWMQLKCQLTREGLKLWRELKCLQSEMSTGIWGPEYTIHNYVWSSLQWYCIYACLSCHCSALSQVMNFSLLLHLIWKDGMVLFIYPYSSTTRTASVHLLSGPMLALTSVHTCTLEICILVHRSLLNKGLNRI